MKRIFWNAEEKRIRSFWRLVIVIWLLLTLSLATSALQFGLNALPFLQSFSSVIGSLLSILVFVGVLWLAGRFIDRRPFADFGFHFTRGWWIDFGFGLALGGVLMTLIFLVELAFGWITISGYLFTPGGSFAGQIASLFIFFIAVGIREEILSRATMLREVAEGLNLKRIGPRGALIAAFAISSMIFGLLHLANPGATWISTVNIMVAGVLLGLGYVLTGELAIPIGLHIAWNFFEGNVFGFPVSGTKAGATLIAIQQGGPVLLSGGGFGPEAGLLGIAAVLLGIVLIIAWVRARSGQAHLKTGLAVYQRAEPGLSGETARL